MPRKKKVLKLSRDRTSWLWRGTPKGFVCRRQSDRVLDKINSLGPHEMLEIVHGKDRSKAWWKMYILERRIKKVSPGSNIVFVLLERKGIYRIYARKAQEPPETQKDS